MTESVGRRFAPYAVLFLLLSGVYYASHYPIAASNEGAYYALIRSMGDEGRFQIDTYLVETAYVDFAIKDGKYYADRAPGTAFLAFPLYVIGRGVAALTGWDLNTVGKHCVTLLPVWAGAAAVLVFIAWMIRSGATPATAWASGMVLALASMHWKFSAHLFSHGVEAFWLTSLWYMASPGMDFSTSTKRTRLFCAMLGFLPVLNYMAAVLGVVFAVFFLVRRDSRVFPRDRAGLAAFAVNALYFALPLVLLGWYHTVCFGAPWHTFGKWHNPELFAFFQSYATMFDTPWLFGVRHLLFGWPGPRYPLGLFVLHPYLLFAVLGFAVFARRHAAVAVSIVVMFFSWLTIYGKFREFNGGSSGDPRYFVAMMPMLMTGFAFGLDWLMRRIKDPAWRALALTPVAALVIAGFVMTFVHFAEYHGHDFSVHRDVTHFSIISWQGVTQIVGRVFVSWRKLHWYLATLLAAAPVVYFTARRTIRRSATP